MGGWLGGWGVKDRLDFSKKRSTFELTLVPTKDGMLSSDISRYPCYVKAIFPDPTCCFFLFGLVQYAVVSFGIFVSLTMFTRAWCGQVGTACYGIFWYLCEGMVWASGKGM